MQGSVWLPFDYPNCTDETDPVMYPGWRGLLFDDWEGYTGNSIYSTNPGKLGYSRFVSSILNRVALRLKHWKLMVIQWLTGVRIFLIMNRTAQIMYSVGFVDGEAPIYFVPFT